MTDLGKMQIFARRKVVYPRIFVFVFSVIGVGCSSNTPPGDIGHPPLTPPKIEVVRPAPESEFEPKGEVRCLLRVVAPSNGPISVLVTTGIWQGDTHSITKFGQVINAFEPDGIYEAEAVLIAPADPGRYTVEATAAFHDEDREVRTVESEPVSILVTSGG